MLRGIVEGIFRSGESMFTLGGTATGSDPWSKSVYMAQVLDLSDSIRTNGLAVTMQTYAASILQQDAIESMLRSASSIKEYIETKRETNDVSDIILGDGVNSKMMEIEPEGDSYLLYGEGGGEDSLYAVKTKDRYIEADRDENGDPDWTKVTEVIDNPGGVS